MKFYRLLSEEEAGSIVERLKGQEWAQGRASSEYATGTVKRNQELKEEHGGIAAEIIADLKKRFTQSPLWDEQYVLHMMPPKFNRYGVGEEYKTHADGAWMGRAMRTDLACTVFLNEDYEGGELCVNNMELKAGPGTAVVYPCWRPHRVKPVTSGERICAVTWLQCLFRDEAQREVMQLFRGVLKDIQRTEAEGRHYADLSSVYSKLMRMWMEH